MACLTDLSDLYDTLDLPISGRLLVERIRNSQPARRVGSKKGNVCVRFPSNKMQLTIQAESRHVEYPYILQCEYSNDVIEFWDQPTTIKLKYKDTSGRNRAHQHTPDFLEIRSDKICFIECKPEDELKRLNKKNPNRYCLDESGNWICPPGIAAAKEFGLFYRVHSSKAISPTLTRNADYLWEYLDDDGSAYEGIIPKLRAFIDQHNAVTIRDLIKLAGSPDPVHWAIAHNKLYVPLDSQLICHPETSYAYLDRTKAKVHLDILTQAIRHEVPLLNLEIGQQFSWAGSSYELVNFSHDVIYLAKPNSPLVRLTEKQLIDLLGNGEISTNTNDLQYLENYVSKKLTETSSQQLRDAISRNEIINGKKVSDPDFPVPTKRTIRYWKQKYREAERKHGCGFIGLIDKTKKRGNRSSKISAEVIRIMHVSIDEDYLNATQKSCKSAYRMFEARCKEEFIEPCSLKTYRNHLKKLDDFDTALHREGKKAAYQEEGPLENVGLPPHGDRTFEVAHIDHTELEIVLVSPLTGEELGRPWLTLMSDAYTRVILAHYLSFEDPSSRSLLAVLRECVRRNSRLPQKIVVDQGAEFLSVFFESLLARYKTSKFERPKSEPRCGAPVERLFGSNQSEFIHDLLGNTQSLRDPRRMSKSHDPREVAIWSPEKFDLRLTEWLYGIYPNLRRHSIHETPNERFQRSLKSCGIRSSRRIVFNQDFIISTLPAVPGNTRKLKRQGIRVSHFDYWSPSLEALSRQTDGINIEVRYDPFDVTYVMAYINGRWEKLICNHHLIKEYSEKEIKFAQQELAARGRNTNKRYERSPEILLSFLSGIRRDEKTLFNQKQSTKNLPVPVDNNSIQKQQEYNEAYSKTELKTNSYKVLASCPDSDLEIFKP